MSILTRKRRRSEVFQGEEEPEHEEQANTEGQSEADVQDGDTGSVVEKGDTADERAKKEREVWDAFREEQYEVLEQLPLSLHRSFALILELDQQVQDNEKRLVPTLREYISVRKKLAGQSATRDRSSAADHPADEPARVQEDQTNVQEPPSGNKQQISEPVTRPQESSPESSASSRQLLTKVANLSEEIVRASNEKVNVARFAYDLVDRYIRDLDRAIKEQETSLSLGLRPGTHPASIILPEVVPPTTTRTRIAQQPPPPAPEQAMVSEVAQTPRAASEHAPASIHAEEEADEDEPMLGIESNESPERSGSRSILVRPRRRRTAKWSRKKKATATPADATDKAEASTPEGTASLKLTVPPLSSITAHVGNAPGVAGDASGLSTLGDMPIDPNEPCYCYCNQVSFGVMVACDNEGNCEREWFHLGCVGLKEPPPPKVTWYCRDCAAKLGKKKKGR